MTRRLHALRVGNFKAFADAQRIPLKPITLIFGPNSAGKSSFIHSLALAHEAQFGRDKRSLSRLDIHHTDVGGSAIDLGGFRQYVHRGQLSKRVEWSAEIRLAELGAEKKHQQLAQLLAPVDVIGLHLFLGIELDDQDRPKSGAEPRVDAVEISGDGKELLRMSRRRTSATNEQGSTLRVDRLASEHAIFKQLLKAMVEVNTTSSEMRPEDFDSANEAIAELLPELVVRAEQFFPSSVDLPKTEERDHATQPQLFPLSRGNRRADMAQAVRFLLPRSLNDLVRGLADVLSEELKELQYLGPLRSFPPRHLAFAEHEDSDWYAGGGYAWDVVRRDGAVRSAVNGWLGSAKLKTPYQLVVRRFVPFDSLKAPLSQALEDQHSGDLEIEDESPGGYWVRDAEEDASAILDAIEKDLREGIQELSLVDKRTGTSVSHRDVGIGISQVLPVLVAAYGSKGKLLAMEQPEIHLHPALQAELADVFIESALGERKNVFILETHSEHLILRLLRRIRESSESDQPGRHMLRPEDVQVLYFQPLPSGARVVSLEIRPDGEFATPWPDGFFPERAEELF